MEEDGEIISRKTIDNSVDNSNSDTYRIMCGDNVVGGVIVLIDKETNHNHLEILFIKPKEHSKKYGQRAWFLIEKIYPNTKVWETCTPYFEKRNIHFYVNKLKFHIVKYYNLKNPDPNISKDYNDGEEGSGMFRFENVIK